MNSGVTEPTKTRPIAVGPLLYRAWAKARFAAIKDQITEVLHPLQVGGLSGQGSRTLLLHLQSADPSEYGYGIPLDFAKAFDKCDWALAAALFRRLGLPARIVDPLQNMWQKKIRWVSYGGHIHPSPICHVAAILQGDVFALLALPCVLAPALRQISSSMGDSVHHIYYMDGRTAVAKDLASLHRYQAAWHEVQEVCGR